MPDLKISQLIDGGLTQATDEFVVARAGTNNKITGANLASAATATINPAATQSGSALVNQADIGSAPNEVPLNQYLGTMAYQDANAVNIGGGTATLSGDLTVNTNALYVKTSTNQVGVNTTAFTNAAIFEVRTGTDRNFAVRDVSSELSIEAVNDASSANIPFRYYASTHKWFTGANTMTFDAAGNLGLGTSTFGTSAAKVLGLANATEPSTAVADTIQFYSVDRSAGNTIPALRCEGTGVTDAGITNTTVTNKIAIKVNGTVYYLLATTNAT